MALGLHKLRRLAALSAVLAAAASLTLPAVAQAQTCPADLSNLIGQIQTASLQPLLTESLDDRVTREGGVAAAIANSQARLDRLNQFKAQMKADDDDATRQSVDESILIVTSRLQALVCRQANSP